MLSEITVKENLLSSEQLSAKFSAISFARAPLTSIHTFYRSRLLTTDIDINSLIAAAAAIFPLLHKIIESKSYANLAELSELLIHEIKTFEIRAQNLGCQFEKIIIARYVLCTVIDEIIISTPWAKQALEPYRLLITFHHQACGNDNFYVILERLSENIGQNFDLLELIYVCFSFGYQGKYSKKNNGKDELASIIDELYRKIRWQRGELHKSLLINSKALNHATETVNETLPLTLLAMFFLVVTVTIYTGFNYLLSQQAAPLYQELNQFLYQLY